MIEWFNSFPDFVQGVLILAFVSTIILIIQVIMLLIGIGVEHDFDSEIPDDISGDADPFNDSGFLDIFGLKILTVRNLICFFAVGGWTLVSVYDSTQILWLSILLGIVGGFITMILFSYAMKMAMKLQNDGTIDIKNTIGKIGTVYLRIPANKSGVGKVHVIVQDSLNEYDAMTDSNEEIPTGSQIVIVGIINECLVVKKDK